MGTSKNVIEERITCENVVSKPSLLHDYYYVDVCTLSQRRPGRFSQIWVGRRPGFEASIVQESLYYSDLNDDNSCGSCAYKCVSTAYARLQNCFSIFFNTSCVEYVKILQRNIWDRKSLGMYCYSNREGYCKSAFKLVCTNSRVVCFAICRAHAQTYNAIVMHTTDNLMPEIQPQNSHTVQNMSVHQFM